MEEGDAVAEPDGAGAAGSPTKAAGGVDKKRKADKKKSLKRL